MFFVIFLPIIANLLYQIVVTNTVQHDLQKLQCGKIRTVDISASIGEAVRRIYHGESMSYLFHNISQDD